MNDRLFTFAGGKTGAWRIVRTVLVAGEPLPAAECLDVSHGMPQQDAPGTLWRLRGIRSNERYTIRDEKARLTAKQEGLGRPESTHAALIPIRKNASWWALPQDERRKVFEEKSKHVNIGLQFLPAIARRLLHCRDLGENEPFDFLTWFEYAPSDEKAFDRLVVELRNTEEWTFVDREIDIRLVRASGGEDGD